MKDYGLYESHFDLDFCALCNSTTWGTDDQIEVLESFLIRYKKVNKLHIAFALYLCEKNKLYHQAYPDSRLSECELKKKYFNKRIPELCSLDRRTISDYRKAGKFIDLYYVFLIQYNEDFFKLDLLKKILLAKTAIKNGFDIQEVIANMLALTKRQFEQYVKGQIIDLSAQPKSKLERYIEVYERQQLFFKI
jgi:hypothetical protein